MVYRSAEAYIASLPEVETARLPRGALFVAIGRIYQVIETGGVFAKARQWRRDESTDVALIPDSFLTRYLPLVRKGRLLPVYRSRMELTQDGQTSCFGFPTETLALDAAYLDVALIMSAGAYVRNHNHEPAFAVTDGVHLFRLYYYEHSVHGHPTTMINGLGEPPRCDLRPHTEGPGYWRVLSSWKEVVASSQKTQQMPALRVTPLRLPDDTGNPDEDPDLDKTRPNMSRPR